MDIGMPAVLDNWEMEVEATRLRFPLAFKLVDMEVPFVFRLPEQEAELTRRLIKSFFRFSEIQSEVTVAGSWEGARVSALRHSMAESRVSLSLAGLTSSMLEPSPEDEDMREEEGFKRECQRLM